MGVEIGLEEKAVIEDSPGNCSFYSLRFKFPLFFKYMLNTVVFISCVICDFQHAPGTLGLIFCALVFHFRRLGPGQFFIVSPFLSVYLGSAGFYSWFWAESLGLHPKLNAQRGCLEYPKCQGFIFDFFLNQVFNLFFERQKAFDHS